MDVTLLKQETVNLKYAQCELRIHNWEDFTVNGKEDNNDNPETPFAKDKKYWCPLIDIDEGKIVGWPQGVTLDVCAKTCDENIIYFFDENKNAIEWFDEEEKEVLSCYDGYVPEFLDSSGEGYGDYVELTVDEDGYIKNFDKEDIYQIFNKEE